jgi:hypothetical protein
MPWLGFFHKISMADVYVALDNVQYQHKYFQNRNKIRDFSGEIWLNVPVLRKGKRSQLIKDVEINNGEERWQEKNWKRIYFSYKDAPYFSMYADYFENLYSKDWQLLVDLNLDIIQNCLKFLGINTKIIRASELGIEGQGEQLILDLCKALDPEVYISGITGIAGGGRAFEDKFLEEGIQVIYQEFHHPIYKQLHEPFIPNMSSIDLLFNHGEDSLSIIAKENEMK